MMKLDVAFALLIIFLFTNTKLGIQTYITCIIHFIRTFGVVQKVKDMGFLQDYKIQ